MVYQPQMTHEGVMYGVEALVRWNSKELGIVIWLHLLGHRNDKIST
ncbi:MAG: hypothetical protein LRY68_08965 [Sulfurospirillum sp.]|nr:hypothetical protein [Sulfurospirillum sp.]